MEAREAALPSLSKHFAAFNSANFRSGVMEAARGRRRRGALDRDAISKGIMRWRYDSSRPPTSWDVDGCLRGKSMDVVSE